MQSAAGMTFGINRAQYICAVDLMLGHPTAGNGNSTSIVDTNVDLFSPTGTATQTRFRCTTANAANAQTLILGTKIGSSSKMLGKDGCTLHCIGGGPRLRCTLGFYGGFLYSSSGLQLQNSGTSYQEIAGSTFLMSGNVTCGNGTSGPLRIYNTTFGSIAGAGTTIFTSMFAEESYGFLIGATAPDRFYNSNSSLRTFRNMMLSGAPVLADIRLQGGATNYEAVNFGWTETPGIPRIQWSSPHSIENGLHDRWTYDTKVVDKDGMALSGIPVLISSDVDGTLVDTTTLADGNISFLFQVGSVNNVLPVRDYYTDDGSTTLTQDRIFTVRVNGYGGTTSPNLAYETAIFKFEWPGRDRLGAGYQADGGSFQKTLDVVRLRPGTPSTQSLWDSCEVS
jgi:hypothetical protein